MTRLSLALAAAAALSLTAAVAPRAAAQRGAAPPRGLATIDDWLSLPRLRDGDFVQFSSSDPTGGNADVTRSEDGRPGKIVIAAVDGPGCITRIWSPNPTGTFELYVDGDSRPRLECPFPDLFQNRVPPFLAPLAGTAGGGWVSLVPIPFTRSCRIEVDGAARLEYEVGAIRYPDARGLASFQTALSRVEKESLDRAILLHRGAGEPPYFPDAMDREASGKASLAPGEGVGLFEADGAGEILAIRLRVEPATPEVLRGALLVAYWDGEPEPAVLSPLGDFFGNAFGPLPYRSLPMGRTSDGTFYVYWPMPFSNRARVEVLNDGTAPIRSLEWSVVHEPMRPADVASMGTFHARWRRATTEAGSPFTVLETAGTGHWVGCQLAVQSAGGFSFLEGDERVIVDGAAVPAGTGTGTAGFFSAGGNRFEGGPFVQPLHGLVSKDEPVHRLSAFRFRIGDAVPFRRSIRVELEHGAGNDAPGADYAAVAYWYQRGPSPATSDFPDFAARRLRPLRVAGAVEAEEMGLVAEKGAPAEPIAEAGFPADFSAGRIVSFDAKEAGDAFRIVVPVEDTGVFSVVAGIATAPDGGRFRVTSEAVPIAADVRFDSERPAARVEAEIGRVRLGGSGSLPLLFTSLGPSAEAPGSRLRLDYVRVVPAEREPNAIEAESLAATGTKPVLVEDARLPWSGGSQARSEAAGAGDAAEFAFEVPVGADYLLELRLTRGPGYGIVRASVDGIGSAEFDAWGESESCGPWERVASPIALAAGRHLLRLEVTGANPRASGHAIGLDAIRIRRATSPGLVEAESLRTLRTSRGVLERVEMRSIGPAWSGDSQARFTAEGPGASFELEVPVAATGLASVGVWYTLARDGALVQLEIDGSPLGPRFDTAGDGPAPAGRFAAGTRHLRAGTHRFRFVVAGKSDASTGFTVGLDAVDVVPATGEKR